MSDLKGKTALVTGGNSGIGRAVATALAERGAHVVLTGRDVDRGEAAVATIRAAGGTADFVKADLGDEASARALARQAAELGGGHVDILVNSAGIFPFGPTHETTEDDFDRVFSVNVSPGRQPPRPPHLGSLAGDRTASRPRGVRGRP